MTTASNSDPRASSQAARILPLLDLTSLGDDDVPADITRLCQAATTTHGSVASVCVWPRFVAQAAKLLSDTSVRVCAVANFPSGSAEVEAVTQEARTIVADGGAEVDVVVPWKTLPAGERGRVRALVTAVRAAIGDSIVLKAILETGELADPELIAVAGHEALEGGADFLKTSTGKTANSASLDAARVLLNLIAGAVDDGRRRGVKISGGVRDVETAARYVALADEILGPNWLGPETFRFGASGLLDDLLRVLDQSG